MGIGMEMVIVAIDEEVGFTFGSFAASGVEFPDDDGCFVFGATTPSLPSEGRSVFLDFSIISCLII